MKTKRISLLALLSVVALLASLFSVATIISYAAEENLLSDALVNLTSRIDNGSGYTVQDLIDNNQWYGWGDRQTDEETGHNGKPSMKVSAAAIGANSLDGAFLKLPAGQYTYSAWIKTDAYQSATTAMNVDIYDVSVLDKTAELNDLGQNHPPKSTVVNNVFYDQNGKNEFSTADWTLYTTEFTLDAEAVVRVNFFSQYSWGTIWASDFAVKAVADDPESSDPESSDPESSDPEPSDPEYEDGNLLPKKVVNLENWVDNSPNMGTVDALYNSNTWHGWGTNGSIDEEIGHNGKPSQKVNSLLLGGNMNRYVYAKLEPGNYRFSAWIKTEEFSGNALHLGARVYENDIGGKSAQLEALAEELSVNYVNKYINATFTDDIYTTEDWTEVEVDFTVTGDTAKYVRLSVEAGHFEGTAWISDFWLTTREAGAEYEDGNLLPKKVVNLENWVDNSPNMGTVDALYNSNTWHGWGTNGSIDEEIGHNGKPSQKVNSLLLGGNMNRYVYAKLEPGNYRFSAWIKTEEFSGNALHLGARVYENDIGGKSAQLEALAEELSVNYVNKYINATFTDDIYTTEDWTEVEVDFTVTGDTAKYVRLSVEAGHFEGTAWISDFWLTTREADPESSDPESSDPETSDPESSKPETSQPGSEENPDTGVTTMIPAALMLMAVSTGAAMTLRRKKN